MEKIVFLALPLAMMASSARADLSYAQTMTMNMPVAAGKPAPPASVMSGFNVSTKHLFKGELRRTETQAMGNSMVFLNRCGSTQSTELDNTNRIYTTRAPGDKKTGQMPGQSQSGKPLKISMNVKNLGVSSWKGQKANRFLIDVTVTTEKGTLKNSIEQWNSTMPMPTCKSGSWEETYRKMPMFNGAKTFTVNNVKVAAQMGSFVPLAQKISMNGRLIGTLKTNNLSTKTLPAALFGVPAGYRKVSPAEFDAAAKKRMMDKMGDILGKFKMPQKP